MKRLMALIQREYWENKGTFRTTPLVIGGLHIVFLLMAMFTTSHFDDELYTFRDLTRWFGSQPEELRATIMYYSVISGSTMFFTFMSLVVFSTCSEPCTTTARIAASCSGNRCRPATP